MREGGTEFFLNAVVLFTEECAAFRMAENDVAAAKILEHRRGNLPRISTAIFPEEVLRAELNG